MMNKKALVIGGSNGIGLAVVQQLKKTHQVTVLDLVSPEISDDITYEHFDVTAENFSVLDK